MLSEYFHLLATLIGIICVIEANILLKAGQSWFLDKRLLWSTTIEFVWLIICFIAVFSDLSRGHILASLIFIVNYFFVCIYTFYLMRGLDLTDPTALTRWSIPKWLLEYYFSFGFIYALLNLALFF
jgi:hypothetical protein